MTNEEAIEILNDMKGIFDNRGHKRYSLSALNTAIQALEKQVANGEYIETLISLYEGFVLHYKEHLLDVESEYLEGIYKGKIKAYNFIISDLKGLLGDNNAI